MKKISVGIVNYLNTRPLLYGIEHSLKDKIELIQDYPANIAALLLNKKIDIGLVPVSILPQLNEYYINTDYCIGCDGAVASVCLFSEVPVDRMERVLLDYQSKTSVALTKILLKDYWKATPVTIDTKSDFRSQIKGTTAGLVIGDRSFEQRGISPYIYDLGQAWKDFTGLPFVFAVWLSRVPLDPQFVLEFNEANFYGLQNIERVIAANPYKLFDLKTYFAKYVSYKLDNEKREGLNRFLQFLSEPVIG